MQQKSILSQYEDQMSVFRAELDRLACNLSLRLDGLIRIQGSYIGTIWAGNEKSSSFILERFIPYSSNRESDLMEYAEPSLTDFLYYISETLYFEGAHIPLVSRFRDLIGAEWFYVFRDITCNDFAKLSNLEYDLMMESSDLDP